jgi:ankyrin repeat protein
MMNGIWTAIIFCGVLLAAPPDPVLFQAIRNNDLSLIQYHLGNGADVNSRGYRDTTPLMYAAAFGTVEAMKVLVDAGADVNAKNAFDATALMWGAADLAKVRLLVDKGSDVNAKSKQGRTPLIIVASHNGTEAIVRFLIAKGADPKTTDASKNTALIAAAQANDANSIHILLDKGVDVNARSLSGETALMSASGNGNLAAVKLLLKAGAEVNTISAVASVNVKAGPIALGKYTALLLSAPYGSPELIRTLLDAGADVNAKDVRGMTPLMMSVSSEYQRPEVVRLLLARGAVPTAVSLAGETAGDWAAKFAHPAVMSLFKDLDTKRDAARKRQPLAAAKVPPAEISKALEKSLGLLQATNPSFFLGAGCAGCHHQQLTAVALKAARDRSFKFDEKAAAEQVKVIASDFFPQTDLLLQRLDPPAGTMITSFSLMALSAMNYPPDAMTDAMVCNVASQQQADGSWHGVMTLLTNVRAPMQDGDISVTAKNILSLRKFGFPGRKADFDERIERARRWLTAAVPKYNEDRAFQLLGLKWAGGEPSIIRKLAKELMLEQLPDGGWSQNAFLPSDAYATGQTLYALNQAADVNPSDKAYVGGIDYLLKNQLSDGSWHVRSRAVKFQPYFESGFPHGHDQWISSAGTAWAAAALALGLPAVSK